MLRLFYVFMVFLGMSFSWGCRICKDPQECLEPKGYGLTQIYLQVPFSYDLKVKERSSFRISFSAKGKTLECPPSKPGTVTCTGDFPVKVIEFTPILSKDEQVLYLASEFFYKELHFSVQHEGVTLFDGIIDFSKEPNHWGGGIDPGTCTSCIIFGTAFLSASVGD